MSLWILGIDPARSGIYWAWLCRGNDDRATCRAPNGNRGYGNTSEKDDRLLPKELSCDHYVAIEDFTFIDREIGAPGIETCVNIGRVVQECIERNVFFWRITRQKVKGHLGISRVRKNDKLPGQKGTAIDIANRQAVRIRGIETGMMTRDHIAAISVALTMEAMLAEERMMEALA